MIAVHGPVLVVILPLFGALVAALVRRPLLAWAVSLIAAIGSFVVAVALLVQVRAEGVVSYRIGGWAPEIGIEYRVDAVNGLILVLVTAIAVLTLVYARRSVLSEIIPERIAWFYAMLMLCLTGLLGMAVTGDAFNVFVFLEISSLSTYVLIALGRDRRALVAAYQYLIVGTIGATFYVIGVGLLYLATGTLNLGLIVERLPEIASPRALIAAEAFIVVGIALKLALFPLHAWLPNAYAYAPSSATVFLASTATKVAVYLLARYIFGVFGVHLGIGSVAIASVLIVLSLAAMFIASAAAVFQNDIKRLLAFSSVAQVGYITLGLALANQSGITGAFLHIVNHALMKGAAFMAVGAIIYRSGTCKLDELSGIGRTMPVTAAALTIAGLGLIGVPGTSGFISKYYLVLGAFEAGFWWVALLIVASSVIAVLYVGRMMEVIWFREPNQRCRGLGEAPAEMLAPMVVLAGMTIWFGLDAELPASLAGAAAHVLLGARP
ncbi:monovalent cation/H+ antiporter subunit D family protein [Kaistia dalseonensis]|uniref:Multicomponent Na+:H+ antiporter subunit D n=1 Tax=Kaistia dalseonensis TaxID=410840 RepID=A0ABU0HFH9_9HYPH|nr:monovalent cation/H+ antiporter subunit D family protein [Kaistia dalseonensis]MCX5497607.1 monovalent cation/H+ antiporter subunit D family protein [Kaistia dalseonensis]MDQ0440249.1 multicomponent Na+:H+ antiporter subunit D [Kaistia dalseonensis]